ncbi:MAG: hypothetical protein LC808_18380 [Actinobacteria bacterium]|nr:hypothetical protein [Actinomycetota bacterium]
MVPVPLWRPESGEDLSADLEIFRRVVGLDKNRDPSCSLGCQWE